MESAKQILDDGEEKKGLFGQPSGAFKLVGPSHPLDKRFKPVDDRQVELLKTQVEIGVKPESRPVPVQVVVASAQPAEDAKIMDKIGRLLKSEPRLAELEEENRALTRTIARLQGEIDAIKSK